MRSRTDPSSPSCLKAVASMLRPAHQLTKSSSMQLPSSQSGHDTPTRARSVASPICNCQQLQNGAPPTRPGPLSNLRFLASVALVHRIARAFCPQNEEVLTPGPGRDWALNERFAFRGLTRSSARSTVFPCQPAGDLIKRSTTGGSLLGPAGEPGC